MKTIKENWSDAHLNVTTHMTTLLNVIRDLGYNPSHHISYDRSNQHLVLEDELVNKHQEIKAAYDAYVQACDERQAELERIQELPKLDIGFSAES